MRRGRIHYDRIGATIAVDIFLDFSELPSQVRISPLSVLRCGQRCGFTEMTGVWSLICSLAVRFGFPEEGQREIVFRLRGGWFSPEPVMVLFILIFL